MTVWYARWNETYLQEPLIIASYTINSRSHHTLTHYKLKDFNYKLLSVLTLKITSKNTVLIILQNMVNLQKCIRCTLKYDQCIIHNTQ